jgi:hypothetical protein
MTGNPGWHRCGPGALPNGREIDLVFSHVIAGSDERRVELAVEILRRAADLTYYSQERQTAQILRPL